jgi:hypothetical protein
MFTALLRRLPPEMAHDLAIWALRTGLYRVGLVVDGLVMAAWAFPAAWLLRRLERRR